MERARVPLTLSERTGPGFLLAQFTCSDCDLVRNMRGPSPAKGEQIVVHGIVKDESGLPVPDALIEVWQPNASGRYHDAGDAQNSQPLDPGFLGFGRCLTDSDGFYRFFTVRPGRREPSRAAHIHFSVVGPAWLSRLVSRIYFEDDPLLPADPAFQSLSKDEQLALLARRCNSCPYSTSECQSCYSFDIVIPSVIRYGASSHAFEVTGESSTEGVRRVVTPGHDIGHFFRSALLRAEWDIPWNRMVTHDTRGERIRIEGQVVDPQGRGLPHVLIEVWQANAYGCYQHPADRRGLPWDSAFIGFGRAATDAGGRFTFDTIKPGPIVDHDGSVHLPHINVAIAAAGNRELLFTRLYLVEETAELDTDFVAKHLRPAARATLVPQSWREEGGLKVCSWVVQLSEMARGGTVFFEFIPSGDFGGRWFGC